MWITVKVTGPSGQFAEIAKDVRQEGDLPALVADVIREYRNSNPNSPLFDYTIAVSKS